MPRNANQSKQSNYSIDFEGADYIDCGDDNMFSFGNGTTDSPFSVSFWTKLNSVTGTQPFLSKDTTSPNREWAISIFSDSSNGVRIFLKNQGGDTQQSIDSSTALTTGVWYHITTTYDGRGGSNAADGLSIYINGSLDTPTNIAKGTYTAMSNTTAPVYIGKYSTNEINGKITEVSIFDYALSASQVTTLWGGGTSVSNPMALPSSPIAYYPLGTSAWNGQYLAENNAIGDYVFDFNSDYIDSGTSLTITRDLTLSGWVKFTSTSSGGSTVISKHITANSQPYYTYRLYIESNKAKFRVGISTATFITGSTDINDGNWHHILGTYDGSNINLYVDGASDATAVSVSGDLNTAVKKTTIGGVISGDTSTLISNTVFNGELSNTQIFNTALLGSEVETLYNYGSPIRTLANIPQNSNLKVWYKLDATEIYNSTSTEWEVNNALSPWTSSLNLVPNDYIDCGNDSSLSISGDLTLSAWVYLDTTPNSYMSIFSKMSSTSRNYTLYARNNRKFSITTQASGGVVEFTTSNTAIPLKTWTHIVVTFDSGVNNGTKYYFNGVQDAITGTHNVVADTSNLNIGKRTTSTQYLDGKISNAQIFNTALSGTEVETLYNSGNPLTDMSSFSSLVSWWKLNNTTTGIEDSKGSNDGTNNGATEAPGSVSTLNGLSSGMSQSNLVQSDLQTVAPYSKYALAFDGTNDYIQTSGFTIGNNYSFSCWLKSDTTSPSSICFLSSPNYYTVGYNGNFVIRVTSATQIQMYSYNGRSDSESSTVTIPSIDTNWHHFALTSNGTITNIYWDGSPLTVTGNQTKSLDNISQGLIIGDNITGNNNAFNGSISNVSVWNAALTSSQVTEIYNEGLPSDLNTFSGAAPVAWWQLGSNSSWNGNRWIVADEIGSNNGYSQNMSPYMPESGLTNGVGTTANGVSDNMSEGSLVGDAPYSTGNAVSSGMPVTARGNDVPPTP